MGALTALLNVQANRVLMRLLIMLWDRTKATFKFVEFEIAPTLEDVSNFTELPFDGKKHIVPSV